MPITPEKRAKEPWKVTSMAGRFAVLRLEWAPTWGLPLKQTMAAYLGDFENYAAAIYAIAKTQE